AWRFAAARLKRAVGIPVIPSNRINTPQLAEDVLARGEADLVALARPLLTDTDFLAKASSPRTASIAPCIDCNQACLDYSFTDRSATCLVNQRARRWLAPAAAAAGTLERTAVGGSASAGLAFASAAAARGHTVTGCASQPLIGGQLQLACRVPGKEGFGPL